VAGGAILRCRLVEEHGFRRDRFHQLVTLGATDVLVRSAQRECGSLVVIEQGRLPLHAVVALGALRRLALRELPSMDVLMAVLAQSRRGLEVDVHQSSFEIRRLMAVDASRRAMRTQQGELSLGMIEPRKFFPRFCGVAGLATSGCSIGFRLLHTLFELSLMDVIVAACAAQVLPVINDCWLRLEVRGFFMTFGTRNCDVSTSQDEVGFLVLRQRKGRRLVALHIMAAIAGIEVRGSRELARVPVSMAIGAAIKLHSEQSVSTLGYVTLLAVQASVPALQRVSRRSMLLHSEQ